MSERQIFSDDQGNVLFGRSEGDLEIYVDGIWGMASTGVNVKVVFYTRGLNSDGKNVIPGERREVAVRLTASIPNFIAIARYFMDQAKKLEEQTAPPSEVQELIDQLERERQEKSAPSKKKTPTRKKSPSRAKAPPASKRRSAGKPSK